MTLLVVLVDIIEQYFDRGGTLTLKTLISLKLKLKENTSNFKFKQRVKVDILIVFSIVGVVL